jgi:hypothetical protein
MGGLALRQIDVDQNDMAARGEVEFVSGWDHSYNVCTMTYQRSRSTREVNAID